MTFNKEVLIPSERSQKEAIFQLKSELQAKVIFAE